MFFTDEEKVLMLLYSSGTRLGLYKELQQMVTNLTNEETHLFDLSNNVMDKLKNMSDEEFDKLEIYDGLG